MKQSLHTPEGVRDIYGDECEKKLYLEAKLNKILDSYGYRPIDTPSFEFFDIFGKEVGTTPSNELYKFFDREGNTLVLRPDITPSIARSAAKYFCESDHPLRFCYKGNTFINHHDLRGRLKECTQIGAELMGDNSVDADAEILAMIVDCLQSIGLNQFEISVGHADIFNGMVEAAGFSEDDEEELRSLISNKNFFGVEEFIGAREIPSDLKKCFGILGGVYQSSEDLEQFKKSAIAYPKVYDAVMRLESLERMLLIYGIDGYVSFELGMISDYHYYTGILLAGYTFGNGEAIVRGGRYDKLLNYFGKESPAIGFAFVVDQLMAAISRQKIEVPLTHTTQMIVYKSSCQEDAIIAAKKARSNGGKVLLLSYDESKDKASYEAYAIANHISRITFMDGE